MWENRKVFWEIFLIDNIQKTVNLESRYWRHHSCSSSVHNIHRIYHYKQYHLIKFWLWSAECYYRCARFHLTDGVYSSSIVFWLATTIINSWHLSYCTTAPWAVNIARSNCLMLSGRNSNVQKSEIGEWCLKARIWVWAWLFS